MKVEKNLSIRFSVHFSIRGRDVLAPLGTLSYPMLGARLDMRIQDREGCFHVGLFWASYPWGCGDNTQMIIAILISHWEVHTCVQGPIGHGGTLACLLAPRLSELHADFRKRRPEGAIPSDAMRTASEIYYQTCKQTR